ncbi:hypothetical protein Enr10x_06910 [Gimesia panareensis]|uniref:Uncharacterized protein n=1 Tax=Gimesia panareensis TaxID=2527978 RepID=A0A517Q175_9PLAN|nr:hypothetical protein Enr10x_06910 [Gimesia panareensis]QDU48355.1 hypothetical protein Pan110_06690 [Gimesia panareensis]
MFAITLSDQIRSEQWEHSLFSMYWLTETFLVNHKFSGQEFAFQWGPVESYSVEFLKQTVPSGSVFRLIQGRESYRIASDPTIEVFEKLLNSANLQKISYFDSP